MLKRKKKKCINVTVYSGENACLVILALRVKISSYTRSLCTCMYRGYTCATCAKLSPSLAIPGEVLLNLTQNKNKSPKTRPIFLYLPNLRKCIHVLYPAITLSHFYYQQLQLIEILS